SRQLGRMRGVAPGAKRTKTKFGGSLEPLTYVRIWFAEKETRDLVRIRQCEVIESSLATHGDYQCSVALSLLAEVTEFVQPEREASDPVFRLLLLATREIERTRRAELPLLYFCLWSVRLAGWLPQFSQCGKCGREVGIGAPAYSSAIHPVLLCSSCKLPGMRLLSAPSISVAREMLQAKLEDFTKVDWPAGKGRDLLALLLDIVEHQIERKLKSRTLLEPNR
ncbi:MAG: DNA repair protein RecO, partial [Acidobacteria bacterium]|nr:DNA repair protein RecO [Acidobacteriota bacterium]